MMSLAWRIIGRCIAAIEATKFCPIVETIVHGAGGERVVKTMIRRKIINHYHREDSDHTVWLMMMSQEIIQDKNKNTRLSRSPGLLNPVLSPCGLR
jgi:hypothetical protein